MIDKYRKIILIASIIVLIISSIIAVCFINNQYIQFLFGTILISLSINIFSSMILIYMLDKRKEEEEKKENGKKVKIVMHRMSNSVKNFNDLIANMYKATMSDEIKDSSEILKDLYYDVDLLYEQLNYLDMYKDGYMCLMTNDIWNSPTLKWKDCFFSKIKEYIASIEEIKNNYFFLLDGEVITSMEKIINTKEKIKIIEQLDNWSSTVPNLFNLYLPLNNDTKFKEELRLNNKTPKDVSGKFLYVQLDFRIMLIETKKIIQYINKYTNRNDFKISKEFFNNSNTSPLIGSGLLESLTIDNKTYTF